MISNSRFVVVGGFFTRPAPAKGSDVTENYRLFVSLAVPLFQKWAVQSGVGYQSKWPCPIANFTPIDQSALQAGEKGRPRMSRISRVSGPPAALAQRGDVRRVVTSVPFIKPEQQVERDRAPLRVPRPARKVPGPERTEQRHPALV